MPDTLVDLVPLIRSGNFAKLRDELLQLRPPELAAALADLRADDQVIAFRILPRRLAATVFEYMAPETQRALVKAMGQEDVAALLNHMSPDDRTLFLSELPANVTKQLLLLLTPEERAEAITLLGYDAAERSAALMTPHYIAVREDWTVQQVLDYVREHGQDSETLNVIYVVDDAGVLIDDIRNSRVPGRATGPPRLGSHGSTVRHAQGHRYAAIGGRRLQTRRSHGVAGDGHDGRPHRHRHR